MIKISNFEQKPQSNIIYQFQKFISIHFQQRKFKLIDFPPRNHIFRLPLRKQK